MFGKIILETTFSTVEPGDGVLAHKHVLHRERNGNVCYNQVTSDGTGWQTESFHDNLEKGIRYFLKRVAEDRKRGWAGTKGIQVILPGSDDFGGDD